MKTLLGVDMCRLAGMTLLLWGTLALAQGANDATAIAAKAEKEARARRFEAAVEGYKQAYELSHDPAYLYNVALLSLLGLKNPLQAWEYAVMYRDQAPKAAGEAEEIITKAEEQLRRTHGQLSLRVVPPNADVYLDQVNQGARLKGRVVWVIPGLHTLIAEAAGHEQAEVQVTVQQGTKSEVAVVLRPKAALLRVESKTPKVSVVVDGALVGAAPAERTLIPGKHVLRAEAPGYKPFEQEVTLGPGEQLVVHADLVEALAARPLAGKSATTRLTAQQIAGWTLVGTGAALAVTGSVLFALAARDNKAAGDLDLTDFETPDAYNEEYDSLIAKRDRKAIASYVTWGVGGAAVLTGVVLLLVRPSARAAIVPAGPGGDAGVSAVWFW